MTSQDVLGWLLASVAGFAAGYVTCSMARRMVSVDAKTPEDPAKERRAGRFRAIFGAFLVVLAIVTFVQSYAVDKCTGASLAAVQKQAYDETQAQIDLIIAAQQDLPIEARIRIRDDYVAAAEALQRARRDSPFRCGGLFPF